MADTSFMKRAALVSLDLPMAGLAALSVGFVLYAMPGPFFAEAMGATGLVRLLPAAEPFGTITRIGVIAAGALLTFLLVWLALRALGGNSARWEDEQDEVAAEVPRLRRADLHPDAPSRRPLLAGSELGEPFDEATPVEAAPEPVAEPPLMLVREAPAEPVAAEPVAAPEPAAEEPSIAAMMDRLERGLAARQRRNVVVELEPAAPAPPAPEPEPEPVAVAPVVSPDDPIDQRLRSALDHLQRLAARGA